MTESGTHGRRKVYLAALIVSVLAAGIVLAVWLSGESKNSPGSPRGEYGGVLHLYLHEKKWGYIDNDGNVVIEPTFKHSGMFQDGLAWAESGDGKSGFIDTTGRFVIEPEYKWVQPFSEGLAFAQTADGDQKFIDASGGEVLAIDRNARCYRFCEGLALYGMPEKQGDTKSRYRYGFIDRQGKIVIPLRFDGARDFHNGYAAVKVGKKYGLIDKKGDYVLQPEYDMIRTGPDEGYEDGLIVVGIKGKYGAVDLTGKVVIEPRFGNIRSFHNGLAPAEDKNRMYGYIDTKGEWVVPARFGWVSDFRSGHAAAWLAGQHIEIFDAKGNTIAKVPCKAELQMWSESNNGVWIFAGVGLQFLCIRDDGTVLWPAGYAE